MNAGSSHVLTGRYPELGSEPIPIEPYISPQYFELEKKYLFKKVWIHVGRVEEIPSAGDYFVKQLDACDASVLVVRNRDGAIHAFHNVCSHRMNKMVYTERGSTKKFFCKFHGWAYDLDGRLVGVPDEKCFTGLKREEHGLSPVNLDTWQGFIFAAAIPGRRLSIATGNSHSMPSKKPIMCRMYTGARLPVHCSSPMRAVCGPSMVCAVNITGGCRSPETRNQSTAIRTR